MASYTIVSPSVRMADERNFHVAENRAWVSRIIEEGTGRTVGIELKVWFGPFADSPPGYFTGDDGGSFRHATQTFGTNGILYIELNETEVNEGRVATLRQVLATWQAASGHSERRLVVRNTCKGLTELLKSLSQTPILPRLQDVGRIQEQSQSAPDDTLHIVEEELAALERRLLAAEAQDGEKIHR